MKLIAKASAVSESSKGKMLIYIQGLMQIVYLSQFIN